MAATLDKKWTPKQAMVGLDRGARSLCLCALGSFGPPPSGVGPWNIASPHAAKRVVFILFCTFLHYYILVFSLFADSARETQATWVKHHNVDIFMAVALVTAAPVPQALPARRCPVVRFLRLRPERGRSRHPAQRGLFAALGVV